MIRVLIADDSAFMRKVLSDVFVKQDDFEVIGTAMNGKDAVSKVKQLKPDLVTMDVNMPIMDGLEALATIMADCPTPVVMISSLTQKGTEATVKALSLGAVDFISKTGGSISRVDTIEEDILAKCRIAAKARVAATSAYTARQKPSSEKASPAPVMRRISLPVAGKAEEKAPEPTANAPRLGARRQNPLLQNRSKPKPASSSAPPGQTVSMGSMGNGSRKLVAIGTSTGGPQALQNVITRLPGNLPCGVVIVQHMPAGFTKSLAERLNSISAVSVKEAEHNDVIEPGHVYLAPGNYHMRVSFDGHVKKIVLSQEPPVGNHRPAVDVMFKSVASLGNNLVSVIMTGMGCDGCEGMKSIKKNGGYSIAQDEATCVVYGMPKAVVEAGLADEIQPIQDIAKAIVDAVKK